MFKRLLNNIRFYVLTASILLSAGIYFWVRAEVLGSSLQTIRLNQIFALLSVLYLYVALLAGPLTKLFPGLPYRGQYLKARRAIGVSVFYFALLHSLIAFFGQLNGFSGLGFLSGRYLVAIGMAFVALVILFFMAITSLDVAVEKLGFKNWKRLHRLVYLAGIMVLIHSVMLGTHFVSLSSAIPRILLLALIVLIGLEAIGLYRKITLANPKDTTKATVIVLLAGLIIGGLAYYVGLNTSGTQGGGLGIHSQHLSNKSQPPAGSVTKSYNVSMVGEVSPQPGSDVPLTFAISQTGTGEPVTDFTVFNEKLAHLVIVDDSMLHFQHVHPNRNGQGFSATVNFPANGTYRLYLTYQPKGGSEQEVAFKLAVGNANQPKPDMPPDTNTTKTVQDYSVSIATTKYQANELSKGQKALTFDIKTSSGAAVTNLKPYLGSFGHLVMINTETYEYLHVHPGVTPSSADASGGPVIDFYPSSLTGAIKPGIYKVFLEFNPDNKLMHISYTIEVT